MSFEVANRIAELKAEVAALQARERELREALEELLDYAERMHGGDEKLSADLYYLARDAARRALSTPEAEPSG